MQCLLLILRHFVENEIIIINKNITLFSHYDVIASFAIINQPLSLKSGVKYSCRILRPLDSAALESFC